MAYLQQKTSVFIIKISISINVCDLKKIALAKQQTMTILGIYIYFIAILAGYRSSKYWPRELALFGFLKSRWLGISFLIIGSIVFIVNKGWTIGLLTALCIYMATASCLLFILNCNNKIRLAACGIFHLILLVGLISGF
ncbi:hypothetical protein C4F40_18275 [Sphingobacterium sp. Ka21]|uniref:DUF3325 domain-containing protein n=1 Tax=Sphingobacterium pedocola TaxID=2082722 RepID=A0ABR9TBF5_9SPHI|nr:hypothetical protein [Sphingobacterium pedocola]